MNLKPFRDISEHEVLNLFSTLEGTVSKGTFVQISAFDPDSHSGPGASLVGDVEGINPGVYSTSWETYAKVKKAQSTTGTIGVTLLDVVPVGSNPNVITVQDQNRYFFQIPSGKTVPVLKRGLVEIGGFSGTPVEGAKGVIGTDGQLVVTGANVTPNVGTFLSKSGADGYAIFQVDCI